MISIQGPRLSTLDKITCAEVKTSVTSYNVGSAVIPLTSMHLKQERNCFSFPICGISKTRFKENTHPGDSTGRKRQAPYNHDSERQLWKTFSTFWSRQTKLRRNSYDNSGIKRVYEDPDATGRLPCIGGHPYFAA